MKSKYFSDLFRKRAAYVIFCIGVGLFSSCSILIRNAEHQFLAINKKGKVYDAIIVPGVPFTNGSWEAVMKSRVLWAAFLYKKGMTKHIIFSGGAVYSPFFESMIMKLYAAQLSIPASAILCDTLAEHSTENVFYSYLLAKKAGCKTVALATDPIQSFLLTDFTFHRFASDIDHLPIVYDYIQEDLNNVQITIDSMQAFKPGFTSIIEKFTSKERFRGTVGKNLDFGCTGFLGPL